jgi:hypothetical protein
MDITAEIWKMISSFILLFPELPADEQIRGIEDLKEIFGEFESKFYRIIYPSVQQVIEIWFSCEYS